jgi:hypothetical protein
MLLTLMMVAAGAGEGCALHPSYVTYALNRTMNDVVARYVTNSLTCASVVEKGESSRIKWAAAAGQQEQRRCIRSAHHMLAALGYGV